MLRTLLGNETIRRRLSAALAKGQLSHCYLLSGPRGAGKHTLARLLAMMMQCTAAQKPCGQCAQCRKILSDSHPDVITVDAPDKAGIPVKTVREACADLYVRPNEGARKIYVFPRAQALNPQGQNALLKCIEEPPPYGAFLLLCEHPEQLLPTIRSRCVELAFAPLPQELLEKTLRARFPQCEAEAVRSAALRSGGYLGQAEALLSENAALAPQTTEFADAFCAASDSALLRVLVPMEKLKRDDLRAILQQWKEVVSAALTCPALPAPCPESRRLAAARTPRALLDAVAALDTALTMLEANVGAPHICGLLTVRLTGKFET